MPALRAIQLTIGDFGGRIRPSGDRNTRHHAQSTIKMLNQTIWKLHISLTYSKQMLLEDDTQLQMKCVFCKKLTHIKKTYLRISLALPGSTK